MRLISSRGFTNPMDESRHIGVWINRSPAAVYAFAADLQNMPRCAAGLATGLGEVGVEVAPANEFGVLDHVVTLPSGEAVYNPMRVISAGPDESQCEVVFTLRRRGMTQSEFDADAAAVAADLATLRRLLEAG